MKKNHNNTTLSRWVAMVCATTLPMLSFGANSQETYFSNALFNTLLVVIMLLAVIVIALANALKSLIGSDIFIKKLKEGKENPSKNALLLFLLMGGVTSMNAQVLQAVAPATEAVSTIGGLGAAAFYTMVTIIAAEVLVLGILIRTFKAITGTPERKKAVPVRKSKPILDKINKIVPIEEEESITLDHVYDGIRELDNDLPPWWKYGFYLTIVVAFIYMIAYHVTGTLPLQQEEYKTAVRKGEAEVAAYMKNSANNVDETTVKLLTEKSDIAAGKDIFMATCAACHGRAGEGGVGPNLTDDYWLHQGGVSDIFKTIKYGWPDKGMKSWKDDFSPMQIAQLTSFIKSLRGTNPPNGKEKQGDLFSEAVPATDSTAAPKDTLQKLTTQVLKK